MGTGPRVAARQAAALFLVAGILALVSILNDVSTYRQLFLVAACDFAMALLGWLVPWQRTPPNATALLGVLGFGVLALSTWSFGGMATGTGPFLVLLYAWAALHFPRWVLVAYAAPATAAYVSPLILTHQPDEIVGSAFVLLPVAFTVAFLIESQGRHLREDRERLARIEQWRAAMISTLAHDVRAPLTTIRLALETLRGEETTADTWMFDSALRQTDRITRLAGNLLDLHRIDSHGHLQLDHRLVSARGLAGQALSYLPAVDVRTEIDDDLTIWVDPSRFEQIIINLVGNAHKYGEPPIVLRISRTAELDRLEVRDHGPGIPESLRLSLFSQFAADATAGQDSVGLGLWIVRQLAEAHGGSAAAEARDPGVAMVVTFRRGTASNDTDRQRDAR